MSRDLSRRRAFGAKAERDRKLELALKHELRAAGTPAAEPALHSSSEGGCLDAETLGAWADGGLDAAQMAAVELHVSTCARCQAIVGAAARSAPVIAPVANAGWFRFPRWALAPLAAAAAITIWMVVPQDTMQAPPAPAPVTEPRQDAPQAGRGGRWRGIPRRNRHRKSSPMPQIRGPRPRAPEEFSEAKRQRANAAPPALQDRAQRDGGTRQRRSAPRRASPRRPPHRLPKPRCRRARNSPSRRSRSCHPTHRGDGASSMARSSAAKTAARRGSRLARSRARPSLAAPRRRDRFAG